jgi:hypothetical protein
MKFLRQLCVLNVIEKQPDKISLNQQVIKTPTQRR